MEGVRDPKVVEGGEEGRGSGGRGQGRRGQGLGGGSRERLGVGAGRILRNRA